MSPDPSEKIATALLLATEELDRLRRVDAAVQKVIDQGDHIEIAKQSWPRYISILALRQLIEDARAESS